MRGTRRQKHRRLQRACKRLQSSSCSPHAALSLSMECLGQELTAKAGSVTAHPCQEGGHFHIISCSSEPGDVPIRGSPKAREKLNCNVTNPGAERTWSSAAKAEMGSWAFLRSDSSAKPAAYSAPGLAWERTTLAKHSPRWAKKQSYPCLKRDRRSYSSAPLSLIEHKAPCGSCVPRIHLLRVPKTKFPIAFKI